MKGKSNFDQLSRAATSNNTAEFMRIANELAQDSNDINIQDENGWTPLHIAAQYSTHEMVTALLNTGAAKSINIQNILGDTPLNIATAHGTPEVVEALLNAGAEKSINQPNDNGWTPLHLAARRGNTAMVKALVNAGARINAKVDGWPPLYIAIENGTPEMVQTLLKAGSYVNQTIHGWTPLHLAAQSGNTEMVTVLLEAGAKDSINVKYPNGKTPLHIAAEDAGIETIRCLLKYVDQTPEQMLRLYKLAKENDKLSDTEIESLHPYTSLGRMLLAGITTVKIIGTIGAIATIITVIALSAPLIPIAPIAATIVIYPWFIFYATIAERSIQQHSIKPKYNTQPASVIATQVPNADFDRTPEAACALVQTATLTHEKPENDNEADIPTATKIPPNIRG